MWLFEPCKTIDEVVSHVTVLKEALDCFLIKRYGKMFQLAELVR